LYFLKASRFLQILQKKNSAEGSMAGGSVELSVSLYGDRLMSVSLCNL